MLKLEFSLYYGVVLFCSLISSFVSNSCKIVVKVSSRGVGTSSLSLLRHNNSLSLANKFRNKSHFETNVFSKKFTTKVVKS